MFSWAGYFHSPPNFKERKGKIMRTEVKIFENAGGWWEVYDFENHKTLDLFHTEIEAYRYAMARDYKLIW
jgi:hypothetical protein